MTGAVIHWEIGGRDAARLRRFYGELFGWAFSGDAEYGLVDRQDGGIGGGILQTPPDVPPYVTVYVAVDDLDERLRAAEALGANVIVPPMPIGGMGRFAMFADPEGNPIGMMEETQAPVPPSAG